MSQTSYEARILRVLARIHDAPEGDLSLDAMAELAAMSRFHCHRVFRGITGETLAQAVRRIRLTHAARWLVQTQWPISEVSARAGYTSVAAFTRAFGAAYGQSPAAFRGRGAIATLAPPTQRAPLMSFDVTIEDRPARRLAGLPHQGAYEQISRTFDQLSGVLGARQLWPQVAGMAGVYYDDPMATPEAELRAHAGAILAAEFPLDAPLEEIALPAGRTAVLLFKGPYSGLGPAYEHLYGVWLPASGEEAAESPSYEVYLNSPLDTQPADLLTEINLPLLPRPA